MNNETVHNEQPVIWNALSTRAIIAATKYVRAIKAKIALSGTSVLVGVRTGIFLQKAELFGDRATQERISSQIHLYKVVTHRRKLQWDCTT